MKKSCGLERRWELKMKLKIKLGAVLNFAFRCLDAFRNAGEYRITRFQKIMRETSLHWEHDNCCD